MPTFLRIAVVSSVVVTETAKPALDRCLTHPVQQSQLAFLYTRIAVAARAERAGRTGNAARAWTRVRRCIVISLDTVEVNVQVAGFNFEVARPLATRRRCMRYQAAGTTSMLSSG